MIEPWSLADEETFRKLWLEGFSASKISERIPGKSRSAICAKARRMNLPARMGSISSKSERDLQQQRIRDRSASLGFAPKRQKAPKLSTEPLPPADPVPAIVVSMEKLEPHHCRWIYGDPGASQWGYCGQEREGPLPYCQQHSKRAYTANYEALDARDRSQQNWKIARAKKLAGETVG